MNAHKRWLVKLETQQVVSAGTAEIVRRRRDTLLLDCGVLHGIVVRLPAFQRFHCTVEHKMKINTTNAGVNRGSKMGTLDACWNGLMLDF